MRHLLLLVLLVSTLASCIQPIERDPEQKLSSQEIKKIELFVPGKPIPSEATNVYYQDWEGMDSFQIVRFDLPSSKAVEIIENLTKLKSAPLSQEDWVSLRKRAYEGRTWWMSDLPASAVGAAKESCWPLRYAIVPAGDISRVYYASSTC